MNTTRKLYNGSDSRLNVSSCQKKTFSLSFKFFPKFYKYLLLQNICVEETFKTNLTTVLGYVVKLLAKAKELTL